jgi:threonine dehydrogenase-like Zn-dependent dehydrogenase
MHLEPLILFVICAGFASILIVEINKILNCKNVVVSTTNEKQIILELN